MKFSTITLLLSMLLGNICNAYAQFLAERVRVSAGFAQGLLAKRVDPGYPKDARKQRIQGTVILKINISKAGDVEDVKLISGHPALAQAAIDAVKQWKYKPYLLNGTAVAVETQVQVNFTLAGS
jgi:periplasmic protein TonB